MPPKPSSPGSPEASRVAARSRRRESIGWRRRATTKEAKRGESGQPWLTPSFMRRVRQVPSSLSFEGWLLSQDRQMRQRARHSTLTLSPSPPPPLLHQKPS
jgi:hypothetical protein